MYDEPIFSEGQWELILQLLEREQDELPVEIHHTNRSSVREELQQRAEMVREMISHVRARTMTAV